jgi:prepilin-type N-terminal cleavage/methylation domain-containing protein
MHVIGSLPDARDRRAGHSPRGFTLVEAMVAISLTAIAGSALLLGTTTSLRNADDAMRQTIAYGMAQQLMDEAVGCRYMELGGNAYPTTPGPNSDEIAGSARKLFDDIGDFNGYRCQSPKDLHGVALGTDDGQGGQRNSAFQCRGDFFQYWRQEIDVYYVSDTNLSTRLPSGQTSDYRAVEVRIVYIDPNGETRQLAFLRRIVAYVPPLQSN